MRRREIFIELTSLLDVILIMLFVLLTQAKTQTGEALESAEAARARLLQTIADGSALKKLAQLVEWQGGDARAVYEPALLPEATIRMEVPSAESGYVRHIRAEEVGRVSMHLGGGRAKKGDAIDLAVGVLLRRKVGDRVERGESLGVIHASDPAKAAEAAELLRACFVLSDSPVETPAFIKAIV